MKQSPESPESPEALAYLEQRGLNDPELIERFRFGFANRTLAYRLAGKKNKAGREVRGQLQKVGLLRQSGHEHFNLESPVDRYWLDLTL